MSRFAIFPHMKALTGGLFISLIFSYVILNIRNWVKRLYSKQVYVENVSARKSIRCESELRNSSFKIFESYHPILITVVFT